VPGNVLNIYLFTLLFCENNLLSERFGFSATLSHFTVLDLNALSDIYIAPRASPYDLQVCMLYQ